MTASSSSVIVVEIDTRKGGSRTTFDSSLQQHSSEQARSFWKTLTLQPHIESRLYSKEINQQLKTNKLKPIKIDNSRKVIQDDPKTETFLKEVSMLNRVDDIMRLQARFEKFETIKESHRAKRNKFNQIANANREASMNNLLENSFQPANTNFEDDSPNEKDDDYIFEEVNEEALVQNLK